MSFCICDPSSFLSYFALRVEYLGVLLKAASRRVIILAGLLRTLSRTGAAADGVVVLAPDVVVVMAGEALATAGAGDFVVVVLPEGLGCATTPVQKSKRRAERDAECLILNNFFVDYV